MYHRYSTAAALLFAAVATVASAQSVPSQPGESTLSIFIQGMPIGTETVTVTSSPDGWLIKGSSRLGAPLNITTSRFEMTYDSAWKPKRLEIEASIRGQALIVRTGFINGVANNDILQAGQQTQKADAVAPDTIVLPNMFFASYEALALRLAPLAAGADVRAYIAPQMEIAVRVTSVVDERIQLPGRVIAAKRFDVTFANPDGPVPAEVWVDASGRLLRVRVPNQGLEVARTDIASVSARVVRGARPGDEQVRMQSNGFALAGTLSRPERTPLDPKAKKVTRHPAVVLVPGAGTQDRDEVVSGISVFAQIATALADAGYVVVRYDKRGVGQSGGRQESATIDDFSDDARAAVNFLRQRKDVDEKRIALVGHSEGGLVALLAASRDRKRVAAVVLVGTPGTNGGELVLEQQRHLLDRMPLPEGERRNRIELQEKIQKAVMTGTGWDAIPPGFRRQAETPWFKSFLEFDPAAVMRKVEEPVLVVQGERDRQVASRHGQLLLDLAVARKKNWGADLVVIEGVNHLMVPAPTGEVTEYPTLTDKTVSPAAIDAITSWLNKKLADPAGKR